MRKSHRRSAAQSLVEFTLLAPLFFMLLVGVLDLGRAGLYFVAGSDFARQGARYAAGYNTGAGFTNDQVRAYLQQQAQAASIASLTIPAVCGTTTPPKPPAALSSCQKPTVGNMYLFIEDVAGSPHYKKVSTVYAFKPITPIISDLTGTIYIVATAAMTVEY